jgi:hypothetical protein
LLRLDEHSKGGRECKEEEWAGGSA